MNRKRLLTYLATITILVSLVSPLMFVSPVKAVEPAAYYKTIPGVLNTDRYLLYPFETGTNLTIGFSKFGELIDSSNNVGLEYGDVDPFAPPGGKGVGSIVKTAWVQGWLVNITYYHKVKGTWRSVWAGALFSDGTTYNNGSWIRVDFTNDYSTTYGLESFTDPGAFIGAYAMGYSNHGGRKTNGTCVTRDIQILYNGSRRFIALLNTTVYDHFEYRTDPGVEDIPLLDVVITIVFDKVKKSVVLLKDVKTKVSSKYATEMKVQFSNRGEVDLGTETAGYASYFHFYTEGISAYNNLTNGLIERTVTPAHPPPYDNVHEGLSTVYNWDYVLNQTESPNWPSSYTGSYPNYTTCGPNPNATGLFDLATAINPTAGYYWYAAFWPILSDWSIDGWNEKWRSLTPWDPHYIDAGAPSLWDEPDVPFYIGEWDFLLHPKIIGGKNQQFRFVTVYGVNHLHSGGTVYTWPPHNIPVGGGDDVHEGAGHINRIDREAAFQLNEVFNPYDLYDSVEKQTSRWVYKTHITSATNKVTVSRGIVWNASVASGVRYGPYAPYYEIRETDADNDAGVSWSHSYYYSKNWSACLSVSDTADRARVRGYFGEPLYKLDGDNESAVHIHAYPTDIVGGALGAQLWMGLYCDINNDGVADYALFSVGMTASDGSMTAGAWEQWEPLGYQTGAPPDHIYGTEPGVQCQNWSTGLTWQIYNLTGSGNVHQFVNYKCHTFECLKEHGFANDVILFWEVSLAGYYGATTVYVDDVKLNCWTYTMEEGKMVPEIWDRYCEFTEKVMVDGVLIRRYGYTLTSTESYYTIDFSNGTIWFWDYTGTAWSLPVCSDVKVLYSTVTSKYNYTHSGRYEWGTVGTHCRAIDSSGLSMVSAAFKNKCREYENGGLDYQDTTWGPRVPYMLAKRGYTGGGTSYGHSSTIAYYDSIGRLYIRDDWCNTTAISSSNIISVGGPAANLLTEYFNDFTDAFIYSTLGNGFMSVACWNRTLVSAATLIYAGGAVTDRYGYAVVTVYKDINGTIGFIIYGWTGQDTYFACRWFNVRGFYNMAGTWLNKNGAEYLQTENRGVTTLILRITYKTATGTEVCPPTVRIMERLGTISEKTPHDP